MIFKEKLGIQGRLYIGFSILILLLLTSMIIVFIKISMAETSTKEVINYELPTRDISYDLNINIYESQSALKNWLIMHDEKFKLDFFNYWNNILHIESQLDELFQRKKGNILFKNWQEVKSIINQLKIVQTKIINMPINPAVITLFQRDAIPLANRLFDILDGPLTVSGSRQGGMFDLQAKQINEGTQQIINNMDDIKIIEYILFVICIIASIIITTLTARAVTHHITIFRKHSSRIASGDLTQRLRIHGTDELAKLGNDLNSMTEGLAKIAKQITDSCLNIVTTLEEVKRFVEVQSAGASEQASSINEITSSLDEIEKSSTQTMEKAKALGEIAERTREKSQNGLQAVSQSIMGMRNVREKVQTIAQTILELSTQTQQVGEITAVVNTLAQQSKMLALNASIEAAKAGDAGKGFSVVAVEVKNLAEQSEQSTTQVQKILEDIRHATEKAVLVTEEGTKGVDKGTELVEQTGEVVRNLSEVIQETIIASQQIEAAVRQEGIGIEQITTGMNEINQVTSSFVESVNQTTEAINNLVEIARELRKYIELYKT